MSDLNWEQTIEHLETLYSDLQRQYNESLDERARLRQELTQARDELRSVEGREIPWTWQGDGTDKLESMSNSMRISITAGQLRELLQQSYVDSPLRRKCDELQLQLANQRADLAQWHDECLELRQKVKDLTDSRDGYAAQRDKCRESLAVVKAERSNLLNQLVSLRQKLQELAICSTPS